MPFLRGFLRAIRKRRFSYQPLIEVRISKEALLHNLQVFRSLGMPVAPVLKSNAYGHGLVGTAKALEHTDAPFFCVDSFFEALILRNEDIRKPILVIGATPASTIEESELPNVAFGIVDLEELYKLAKQLREHRSIHLKIDTGMHRHGIQLSQVQEAIGLLKANPRVELAGVYTHLADADTANSVHAKAQIKEWNRIVKLFREAFPNITCYHGAATAGSAHASEIEATVMRLGLGLYGCNAGTSLDLRPALEMSTNISSIRTVKRGETVGYNATFTALSDLKVATIPAGYYEGIDRRLSNVGSLLVRGIPCPIVGRVSMNITSIDVSNVPDVSLGDTVTVISADPEAPNSVEAIAEACNTIPYEIFVRIPQHLRRLFF